MYLFIVKGMMVDLLVSIGLYGYIFGWGGNDVLIVCVVLGLGSILQELGVLWNIGGFLIIQEICIEVMWVYCQVEGVGVYFYVD